VNGSLGSPKSPSPELWTRLTGAAVARLATHNPSGAIDLVPFTFAAVDAHTIVSAVDHKPKRTTNLQRLDNIRADPAVTVLADHYEDDWTRLWWVRARGDAIVLDAPAAEHLEALTAKYAQYRTRPPNGPVIVIDVTDITGWDAQG
jgi:PPOX class probable F420-dependent enzyme